MLSHDHKKTGNQGELTATGFLEARGYCIVDANVRPLGGMARGEIDLIAWQGDTLVFIEVKTRRRASGNQGTPAEAIDSRKRRQLTELALAYIAKHQLDDVPCRFDVVTISPNQIHLLPNAFE